MVSRDSVFYVVFAKLFLLLAIFNLFSGQEHLYPIPSSSPKLISHWCSQNICWLNKWRNECVNSLSRVDLIFGIIDLKWEIGEIQHFLLVLVITFSFPSHSNLPSKGFCFPMPSENNLQYLSAAPEGSRANSEAACIHHQRHIIEGSQSSIPCSPI